MLLQFKRTARIPSEFAAFVTLSLTREKLPTVAPLPDQGEGRVRVSFQRVATTLTRSDKLLRPLPDPGEALQKTRERFCNEVLALTEQGLIIGK